MSKHRYVGGIISSTLPTPSQASASGVWTLDEAQYYQKQGNWPSGSGADPYFQNTTLLLHGDGTNGAQNNTFLDSSTNNFTITRNGNTTQGAFNPYVGPGNWSNYFDGTGDYLTAPANAAYAFGTGDFTVEAWVYPVIRNATYGSQIAGPHAYTVSADWLFIINTAGNLYFQISSSSTGAQTSTSTVPLNSWSHVVVVRLSGTVTFYINGVAAGSGSYTTSVANTQALGIGAANNGNAATALTGYISNLRIVKGTAVYTSAFTPSTTPLVATTQTVLLTCNNNGFIDQSAANNTLTRNGDTRVSKFSPFTLYQVTPASYSGYFDGTGDYLSAPTSSVQLGAQEFTFETWVYFSEVANDRTLIYWNGNTSGNAALHVRTISARWALWISQNGSSWAIQQNALGSTIVEGQWYHVAVVRAGNNVRMFVNGTDITSGGYTLSGSLMTTYTLNQIGVYNSAFYYMQGSLSNFRIVSGTAVYTANFTPPTSALTTTTTVPSNQSNSVSFDGSGDYLNIATSTAFGIGTGDFTIEYWVYFNSLSGTPVVFDMRSSGADTMLSDYYNGSGNPVLYYNSANLLVSSGVVAVGSWNHIVWVRSGTTITSYVNGVARGTATSSANFGTTQPFRIGANITPGAYVNGYISNFRFVKGAAVYTSNFTPSTTPLTTTSQGATAANVSLLTCQDTLLEDNSLNYFRITPFGDARPSSANPFVSTNGIGGTSYSGFFDGTGDYLNLSSPVALAIGTNSFTWEAWVFPISTATFCVIYDNNGSGDATGTGRFLITMEVGGQIRLTTLAGTSVLLNSGTSVIPARQWTHIAISRSGTTGYLFFNGVVVNSATVSTNFLVATNNATNRPIIGANGFNTNNGFNGYISNLRVVNGTALYTSAFSPSTTPLTSVTNTALLTCQSTTFIDNSTNAFPISVSGNAVTNAFNPYSGATTLLTCQSTQFIDNSAIPVTITANGNATPKLANPFTDTVTGPTPYTAATYGGSAYFDGTGDYLTVPDSALLEPGSNNFTVECWFYMTGANPTNGAVLFSKANTSSYGPITVGFTSTGAGSGITALSSATGSTWGITLLGTATATTLRNSWNHVAYVRNGNVFTLYLNGAVAATTTNAIGALVNNTELVRFGQTNFTATDFPGFISNLRYVVGTAVYTGPFVPPAAPVTAVANTQLLLNGTNAGIFDNTTVNNLETIGSAQVSTSVVKYGTGSISFNGLNSIVYEPSNIVYGYGTGDFTIEFWVRLNSTSTQTIFSNITLASGLSVAPHIYYQNASSIRYYVNGADRITGSALNINQWYHIAVCRSGTSTKMFIDGVQAGSTYTDTNNYGSSNPLILGDYASPPTQASLLNGYLDDIRVTRGVARYTANFTPPAAAFPNF